VTGAAITSSPPVDFGQLFQILAESARDYAIFLLDTHGNVTTWTATAQRMKGYTADEIIGRHFSIFYPPLDVQNGKPEEELRTALKTGQYAEEGWRVRKDGSRLWTITCLHDSAGKHIGFAKITRDLTQQRDLQEERELFFSLSLDMLCIAGFDGYFKRVNPAFTRVLQYSEQELTSRPWIEFVHPDDVQATIEQGEKLVGGTAVIEFENRYRRKDGAYRWLSWAAAAAVETKTICAAARDVTDRRRADERIRQLNEDLIRQTAELEAATRELEAFSYSVSHDLRAPLRALDGFSQALMEDYSAVLDEEGKDHLKRIRAASQRMGTLIDDLLNLSRYTRVEMRSETVDLSGVAHEVVDELKAASPERRVEVHIAEGLKAEADPSLMRIVLVNLIGNAWKFSAKCASPTIEFGSTEEDDRTVYFVRDNGAGFDLAYAQKLFGAFQRMHSMSEFPGTGIGLATVKRIINRHGGKVWAQSAAGAGATFYFTL